MENKKALENVLKEIESQEEKLIETTQQLVKIPSLTGQETEAQQFMEAAYRSLGLEVDTFTANIDEIKQHPTYIEIPGAYENRPNVVATLSGSENFPSLILNGHVDVVSAEPVDQWTVDPWGGEIKNGKLYGRGAVDMKAGVVANLFAVKAILDSGVKPKGSVILQSVIEEEAGGSGGTLACFMRGYKASGMLISEPSGLEVVVCHPGIKYFRVRAVGKTAHAALSHTGVNVIGKMNKIYDALVELDEKRAAEHHYPLIGKDRGRSCNLNIGTYSAGDWASSVAGMATMECRIGFIPGEKGETVMREVEQTILETAKNDSWLSEHLPTVEWYGWNTEPWVQDQNDPFVRAFLKSSERLIGKTPNVHGTTGGLDTRFGPHFGTPSFSFGPSGDRYHGPDEYVEVSSITTLTKIIAGFVLDWCGCE